jgi:hypothetical protein
MISVFLRLLFYVDVKYSPFTLMKEQRLKAFENQGLVITCEPKTN